MRSLGPHTARGGDWCHDWYADLEVKGVWVHSQVVRENWTGRRDALCSNGGHNFTDGRTHDGLNLRAWNGQSNDGGELGLGLYDLRFVEHENLLVGA